MRKMGGLSGKIPWTWALMLIGTLALTGFGIPGIGGMAGFFSKDAIIEATFAAHTPVATYAYWLLLIAAFMTSFYSWRLMFMTFHGKQTRADHHTYDHAHESPWVMIGPLLVLALGAIAAGALFHGFFIGEGYNEFWKTALYNSPANTIRDAMEHVPATVSWAPTIAMVLGFALSWFMYIQAPSLPAQLAGTPGINGIYQFLLNKWYFDELYDVLFVQPAMRFGRFLWKRGDGTVIDGLGPDGIAKTALVIMRDTVRFQTGFIYHYAFVMLIGVTLIATVFAIPPGIRQHFHDVLFNWLRTAA